MKRMRTYIYLVILNLAAGNAWAGPQLGIPGDSPLAILGQTLNSVLSLVPSPAPGLPYLENGWLLNGGANVLPGVPNPGTLIPQGPLVDLQGLQQQPALPGL